MEKEASKRRIAKYDIERMLGKGAMGVVYKALDAQIEREVAIKVLHKHLLEGAEGKELVNRFVQEAKAAARCLHQNLVSVFDFGFHEDQPYIAMEFVDGVELKAQLQTDTPYTLDVAADITIQILKGLDHAHGKGIVHRDIKPSNIILLPDGSVKITDFGVARIDTSELTHTGYMIGTPNYMSPEGLQGLPVDHRSDLYSVGVLFYELLTHMRPVRGLSIDETLTTLDGQTHLSVQNINSIKPIIKKALHPHEDGRFQTAKQFIEKLRNIDDMELTDAKTNFFISPVAQTVIGGQKLDTSPSKWSPDMLDSLEQSLAKYVGPMAHYLVKKNSRTTQSLDQLSQNLSTHIPSVSEREEFIRSLSAYGVGDSLIESSGGQSQSKLGTSASKIFSDTKYEGSKIKASRIAESDINKVSEILVFYLGPLAKRLAKKEAKKSVSLEDFHRRVAQNIPNENERSEFFNKLNSTS